MSEYKRPLEPIKRAIVVGASSGMGAALSRILVQNGYIVGLVARRERKLADLCDSLNLSSENGARSFYFKHDVRDIDIIPALFQEITEKLGGLDLIIYAAGQQYAPSENEYDLKKDADIFEVNLIGAMGWLNEAAFRFSRLGTGHIVGISSIAGDRGRRLNVAYNASKAGLNTFLEGMRNRLTRKGITVTTIKPGMVDTAKLAFAPRKMWVIKPEDAASQIYLAIRKKKQTAYVPRRWRYFGLILRHIPSIIFRRLNI